MTVRRLAAALLVASLALCGAVAVAGPLDGGAHACCREASGAPEDGAAVAGVPVERAGTPACCGAPAVPSAADASVAPPPLLALPAARAAGDALRLAHAGRLATPATAPSPPPRPHTTVLQL